MKREEVNDGCVALFYFSVSAFQYFSFYLETLPPLVDFPGNGKNQRVGCMGW
jgi:hypothetical protein